MLKDCWENDDTFEKMMNNKTRGAIVPMPPPETVFEIPKSVPEKFGARSTWLDDIWWERMVEQYLVRTYGWTIFVEIIWLNNICWEHMVGQYLLRMYGWTMFLEKIWLDNICWENICWEHVVEQYLVRAYVWTIFENKWLDNICWEHMVDQYLLRTYG